MFNRPRQVVYATDSRVSPGMRITVIVLRIAGLLISLLLAVAFGGYLLDERAFHKHFTQGGRYLDQKRYDDAAREYRAAIAAEDTTGPPFYNLALCYTKRDQYAQAVTPLQKAIQIDPKDENYHFLLARCHYHLSHLDLAVAEYREAIQLKPDDPDAHYNLAMIERKLGNQADSLAQLNQAHRLRPADPDVSAALKHAQSPPQ